MQKQFINNIFLLLLINFLIKPFYVLAIDAQVQNRLGDETYGVYFALFNFCFLFQVILDMGIQNYNSKTVAQAQDKVAEHFGNILGTKFMLIGCFIAVISVAGLCIGYPRSYFPMLWGIGLIMVLQSLYVYLRSHFSALGYYRLETWLSVLDKLLMILIIGYFLYVSQEISIGYFIGGQIAGQALSVAIALSLLGGRFELSLSFSWSKGLYLLKKTFPFALVFILMTLYTRMDGVMLERLIDDNGRSAGIYATGYRLLDAVNILGYLFAVLLLPMYAKLLSKGADLNPLTETATGLLLTLGSIISIGCWFYAEEMMGFVYTDISVANIMVFKVLMIGFWCMTLSYIFGSMITASGELRIFNLIFVVGIVINWGLNLYLIPIKGEIGAAIATLVTQFFVFISQFTLALIKFNIRYSATYILKVFFFMLMTYGLFYFMKEIAGFLWIFEVLIGGFILLLASFLIGLCRLSLWKEAYK